ncbi:small GTP-binding protein [Histomonas meleagridis]|uniref:small GTP-binding protein n=1 Tax=Histomonas meleagridis TaxID=135588 RepID=UPI0035596A2F|nr:small GTP-binding protein [Histomonas meleagridis]KAH0804451.1 small GTP-binding protein [Histomonas meleagridis]
MYGNSSNCICKLVFLGNSGVGKTSLAFRWSSGTFSDLIKPTIGANHQRKTIDIGGSKIDLYVWDTSGQEQFQSLTPLYVRSASVALIVASINDMNSFDSIQVWLDLLANSCDNIPPAILAINKIDQEDLSVITKDQIEERFVNKFNSIFYVSAATGENVNNLFTQAAKVAYSFVKSIEITDSKDISLQDKKNNRTCC